jgi:site-specific recombinase XerD
VNVGAGGPARIRNRNTREAYWRAVTRFTAWAEARGVRELHQVKPLLVAAYVEQMMADGFSKPTVKQHLAAIRKLFDWMVSGGVLELNPASSVESPKHIVRKGKTPVLDADQTRQLLDGIATETIIGLRDRAVIGAMVYTFGRVSAVINMQVGDYFQSGKRWCFRLNEKGGKYHEVPAHHNAEAYVDAYLEAAGIARALKTPLFRSIDRSRQLTDRPLHRCDVLAMIKRRVKAVGLPATTCCHTFRATGITTYLKNGGTLEHARAIAAHASSQTTRL